ncbi:MAG: hypothetical protein ACRDOB_09995 [Streptosporangiaceae bacterium]
MSFNVLAVRSGLDTEDDALHPILSDASRPELIALDAYDGTNVVQAVATAVCVMQVGDRGLRNLVRLRDVKINIYITDGRLALACEKYDKGGGWVGFGAGAVIAITANAVSKARAASRSRGKVLVGHIRYPWLKAVGASSKTGFASTEAIRLEYTERISGASVRKVLELTLPRNIDATLVAGEIAQRAAAFRLAYYPELRPDARARFASLSQAPPKLQPEPKKFAFYHMPTHFHANKQTAFPPRPEAPAPARTAVPHASARHDDRRGIAQVTALAGQAAPASPARLAPPVLSFCTQCGMRFVPGDNFCQQCGAPLNEVDSYTGQHATGY